MLSDCRPIAFDVQLEPTETSNVINKDVLKFSRQNLAHC